MDNSPKKLNLFLILWIFAAVILIMIFTVLYLQAVDTAPEDSEASEGGVGVLVIKPQGANDSTRAITKNLGETITFDIDLSMVEDNTYRAMELIIQYPHKLLELPESGAFSFSEKYLVVDGNPCTKAGTAYKCVSKSITIKNEGTFNGRDNLGTVKFKAIKIGSDKEISLFPSVGSFSKNKHSYFQDPTVPTKVEKMGKSSLSEIKVDIIDACLGDYNNKKGVGQAVVDLDDFSNFGKFFNTPLSGDNLKYDLVNTDGKNTLNAPDLSIFTTNYGQKTCQKKASDI